MDNQNPTLQTVDMVKRYVNLKIDITLIQLSKKLSNAAAYFVFALILGFLFLFISLFLSLSLADWLADVLHMPGMGNLIVSAIYLLLGALIYIFREPWILKPISKNMGMLVDMSDLNHDNRLKEYPTLEAALSELNVMLKESEKNIDQNIDDIKDFYSFEQMKNRFLKSIINNPQSILTALLFLREIIINRKKRK